MLLSDLIKKGYCCRRIKREVLPPAVQKNLTHSFSTILFLVTMSSACVCVFIKFSQVRTSKPNCLSIYTEKVEYLERCFFFLMCKLFRSFYESVEEYGRKGTYPFLLNNYFRCYDVECVCV